MLEYVIEKRMQKMKVPYNFFRILSFTQKGFTMKSNKFNASFGCLSKLRMPATKRRDVVAKRMTYGCIIRVLYSR